MVFCFGTVSSPCVCFSCRLYVGSCVWGLSIHLLVYVLSRLGMGSSSRLHVGFCMVLWNEMKYFYGEKKNYITNLRIINFDIRKLRPLIL